jgi:phosphohistidine phosphatase SixA
MLSRRHQLAVRLAAASLALATVAAVSPPAAAEGTGQQLVPRLAAMPLMDALRGGGYTLLVRHASTGEFMPDPAVFDPDDCTTQRNLSDAGRRQAERIGQSFAKLGIRVDRVLSSPYCRCMDTGTLAFGGEAVETSDVLLVGDSRPGTGREDPGIAVRELLDTAPEPGKNTVLIAHSVTLLYTFGLTSNPEGIAHVFRPTGLGLARPEYVGMVKPEEWPVYAGLDSDAGAPADAAPEAGAQGNSVEEATGDASSR